MSSRGLPGSVASDQTAVIQTPELGARIMDYELANYEWAAIKPMLPNKPCGVPWVNDRRVSMASFWVLRSERLSAIYPKSLVRTPPATIDLLGGSGLVSGAASSTHLPVLMMPLSR